MNDKQTLTLEAGKYYKTRDGRKAYVAGKMPQNANLTYPYLGCIYYEEAMGTGSPQSWDGGGKRYGGFDGDHEKYAVGDLVGEWVEPRRIKGWVSIGKATMDATSFVYKTKEEAIGVFGVKNVFACIEVDVLEGEGL